MMNIFLIISIILIFLLLLVFIKTTVSIFFIVILVLLICIIRIASTFKPYYSQSSLLDVAVIVEPRNDPLLVPIVLDTIKKIPQNTKVYIFHGTDNIEMIHQGLSEYIHAGKIVLINMGVSNITVKNYSDMLTTKEFWNQIDGENILIFQTDSCICSFPDHSIYNYLEYGYVGAPILNQLEKDNITAQNGGFSLRKKSKMLEAIRTKLKGEDTFPEDVWFSVIKKDITNPAPFYLANTFSVESIYYDRPFGIHKTWGDLTPDELERLKIHCPEINTIFGK
jgi:hypothetical protein